MRWIEIVPMMANYMLGCLRKFMRWIGTAFGDGQTYTLMLEKERLYDFLNGLDKELDEQVNYLDQSHYYVLGKSLQK